MKLYYTPGACSLSDHIVLEWIGRPYEAVRVSREERKSPAYLAINPAGAVPAFEENGWVLTQNAAILNYLADSFPDAGLAGDGTTRSRAEVNKWLAMANADIHPAFHPLFGPARFLADDSQHEAVKQAARTRLRGIFERAEKQLDGRQWIAGFRSFADPYLYITLRWAQKTHVDLSGFDNLAAFKRRMEEDSGVRAALRAEGRA